MADFIEQQRIIDGEINYSRNDCGPVSRPKDYTANTCNFWHGTLCWQKQRLLKKIWLFCSHGSI